ncbi:MAG TPA: iron chelate uptake ABC transporter family permease subunit [Cyclobacteriaceae bacterium]|nr:metal ABC transporter permease [Cyclobacteriaceae bacterium]HMV10504.1 iron chelate uptake ABC transporter family permease subunit [Cyclobacteriaceae bacterium]HMV89947.1 iron chelate uptake ABC transporter family permease subunit [Cyclobacteriaceae bacterium]HMX01797.1 iron chelate uptake ABC transporter family permease subunit [Cyclobacteriaceae bacterium]HMX51544.1 iron chelate uptake ABC transporter family permease subunit [Cyclobacteriaceae bacterium]
MNSLAEFFSFADPNIRYVVLGSVLLTASSAIVGTFTFLNKRSLIGDAIAHAVLPGICLGFIVAGTKNPLVLIVGAFITGWLSLIVVEYINRKTRIKEDTAIGLVLSVFFGIGILMLTVIQKSGNASQSGLDHFLFGKAAALVGSDLFAFLIVALILLVVVYVLFKEFALMAFDKAYAKSIGYPVRALELILTSLIVLAVVIGIQAVGVVLMAAILITPAAAARFWTDKIVVMVLLASAFGAFSGLTGAYISFVAPAMPTGPWIVIVISMIAFISFFLAPKRGVVYRLIRQNNIRQTINNENVLKVLYQLGEENKNFFIHRHLDEIIRRRKYEKSTLQSILRRLLNQGYVEQTGNLWSLTEEGKNKAQRVVKIHRLWELYLTTYMKIAPDHVHEDAETIEHLLTPELEAELEKQLGYAKLDPHQTKIPYQHE